MIGHPVCCLVGLILTSVCVPHFVGQSTRQDVLDIFRVRPPRMTEWMPSAHIVRWIFVNFLVKLVYSGDSCVEESDAVMRLSMSVAWPQCFPVVVR